jgi:hypothetical protein
MFSNGMFSNGKICPDCHTESLHHSHRPNRDWFLSILRLRSVRCICCYQRFYVSRAAYRAEMTHSRLN